MLAAKLHETWKQVQVFDTGTDCKLDPPEFQEMGKQGIKKYERYKYVKNRFF